MSNADDILLVDTKGAAKMLSMKVATLRQWQYKNKGPKAVKIGGLVRYKVSDLQDYVNNLSNKK